MSSIRFEANVNLSGCNPSPTFRTYRAQPPLPALGALSGRQTTLVSLSSYLSIFTGHITGHKPGGRGRPGLSGPSRVVTSGHRWVAAAALL